MFELNTVNLSMKHQCAAVLTWNFINFIKKFALDLLKHVVLVDLGHVARGLWPGGGDDSRGGGHGHVSGTDRLRGCQGLWLFEEVELHCQSLGAVSLKHTQMKHQDHWKHKTLFSC